MEVDNASEPLIFIYGGKNRLGYMPKNGEKVFILLILLSLIFIRCGGGSGGGGPSGEIVGGGRTSGGNTNGGTAEGEITFAWDSETDPAVAGYKIHYGTVSKAVSGQYENSADVGMATQISSNTTSYTLRGLTSGQTYYIAVTAYDKSHIESTASNEVSGAAAPVIR
jgi:hypothetical protein